MRACMCANASLCVHVYVRAASVDGTHEYQEEGFYICGCTEDFLS